MDETDLLGREAELAFLAERLKLVLESSPAFVLLDGVVGVGKTALLLAACRPVRQRPGVLWAFAECVGSHDRDARLAPWASVLRQLASSSAGASKQPTSLVSRLVKDRQKVLDVATEIMGVIPGADFFKRRRQDRSRGEG